MHAHLLSGQLLYVLDMAINRSSALTSDPSTVSLTPCPWSCLQTLTSTNLSLNSLMAPSGMLKSRSIGAGPTLSFSGSSRCPSTLRTLKSSGTFWLTISPTVCCPSLTTSTVLRTTFSPSRTRRPNHAMLTQSLSDTVRTRRTTVVYCS